MPPPGKGEKEVMEETDEATILRAIETFKFRHGIKAPLTTEGMDKIIIEIKEEKKKKAKGRKK